MSRIIIDEDTEKIVARLITVRHGGKCSLFANAVAKNGTGLSYEGIPVYVIGGYHIKSYSDALGPKFDIEGETLVIRSLDVMTMICDACKHINLDNIGNTEFAVIVVYTVNEENADDSPIELDEMTKFKCKFRKFVINGMRHRDKVRSIDDDDTTEKKSFVVDTEVE